MPGDRDPAALTGLSANTSIPLLPVSLAPTPSHTHAGVSRTSSGLTLLASSSSEPPRGLGSDEAESLQELARKEVGGGIEHERFDPSASGARQSCRPNQRMLTPSHTRARRPDCYAGSLETVHLDRILVADLLLQQERLDSLTLVALELHHLLASLLVLEHRAVATVLLLDRLLDLLQVQLGRQARDSRDTLATVALLDADGHLALPEPGVLAALVNCS